MYGYLVNLDIKSQHFPCNPNPINPETRKLKVRKECISNGCQYGYWKAKVSTKAMISYGYQSKGKRPSQHLHM